MDRTVSHLISRLKMILVFLVIVYVTGGVALYFLQDRIIFLGERLPDNFKFEFDTPFEELLLETGDSARISVLHFKADSSKGLIVYYHGNAGNMVRWGQVAEEFVPYGYDVAIMDYRGYGKSTGKRSQSALLSDALLVYDHFKVLREENELIVYGRSIGTGMASYVVSRSSPAKVILETPFFNLKSLAQSVVPIFPVSLALKYRFPNDQYLSTVKCPIYIFHGTDDEVVPISHGQNLFDSLDGSKMMFVIEGGRHNNLSDFPSYWKGITEILGEKRAVINQ